METNHSQLIVSLLIFITLIIPAICNAEEPLSEVLIVVKKDEVLAFSSLKNNWVSEDLSRNEKVSHQDSKGNVAIIATNKRILGFSVYTNSWGIENLSFNEKIQEIQVDGNVATIETDRRVFGFNARNGEWLEAD